jgi:hypothetical protein
MTDQKIEVIKIGGEDADEQKATQKEQIVLPVEQPVVQSTVTTQSSKPEELIQELEKSDDDKYDTSSDEDNEDSSSDSSSDSDLSVGESDDSMSLKSDSSDESVMSSDKENYEGDDDSVCATSEILKSKPYYFLLLSRFLETTKLKDEKMEEKNITDVLYDISGHLKDISLNLEKLVEKKSKK